MPATIPVTVACRLEPDCRTRAGEAEVAQDKSPVRADEDVGGLDVAVQDAGFVGVVQGRADLLGDGEGQLGSLQGLPGGAEAPGQAAPGHVLGDGGGEPTGERAEPSSAPVALSMTSRTCGWRSREMTSASWLKRARKEVSWAKPAAISLRAT